MILPCFQYAPRPKKKRHLPKKNLANVSYAKFLKLNTVCPRFIYCIFPITETNQCELHLEKKKHIIGEQCISQTAFTHRKSTMNVWNLLAGNIKDTTRTMSITAGFKLQYIYETLIVSVTLHEHYSVFIRFNGLNPPLLTLPVQIPNEERKLT